MKKFMKAIAFATVMCMLLSTVAFAAVNEPTLVSDYNLTVTVAASGTEQVALLVLKAGTALEDASSSNVYFVGQDAANNGTATFDVALDAETLGDETTVDIYAGYASNPEETAVSQLSVDVVETQELRIVIDGAIEVIPDAAADPRYVGDAIAESDKGALVYATVSFENYDNEVVTNIGWQFVNADGAEKRIDYPVSGLEILDGDVQVGVAFTNGNGTTRAPFVTESTNVSLWFKFADKLLQAVAE